MLNIRTLRDVALLAVIALPAAGAIAHTAAINTSVQNPGRFPEGAELLVELPATPDLVDAKTITLTVEDSADGVTFTAVADLPTIVLTGAGGLGAGAVERRFKLPIGCQQYFRLAAAVLADGGDNTAISASLSFVF